MPRMHFRDRPLPMDLAHRRRTFDAVPREPDLPEPTGLTSEFVSRPSVSNSTQLVAELPGSAADYFIQSSAEGRRALLYYIGHDLIDFGTIWPQSEADRITRQRDERGREEDLTDDPGEIWPPDERERIARQQREAESRVEDARLQVRRATGDRAMREAGVRLGRATRQRDAAALRQRNLQNRQRYGAA
jgi:hypothetical protein